MRTVGEYLEYRGGCSVPWGVYDTCGGYHEYRGGVQYPWGGNILLLFEYLQSTAPPPPPVLNTHYTGCLFHNQVNELIF